MFEGVQKIVWSSLNPIDGQHKVLTFAAQHTAEYDETDYWQAAATTALPFDILLSWAKEGLEKVEPYSAVSVILLDCGDCPDIFRLTEIRLSPVFDYHKLISLVKADVVRYAEALTEIFKDTGGETVLVYHYVRELNHPSLSYQSGAGFHGSNGYLLWLSAASLALRESLRDEQQCQRVLAGRKSIIVLTGFEEIFFYMGTISTSGLHFDEWMQ
jgi:hypothetical protein